MVRMNEYIENHNRKIETPKLQPSKMVKLESMKSLMKNLLDGLTK